MDEAGGVRDALRVDVDQGRLSATVRLDLWVEDDLKDVVLCSGLDLG